MLTPEESINDQALYFHCRICNYYERAQEGNEFENCVYKTDYEAKESQLVINPDIVKDPTLSKKQVE